MTPWKLSIFSPETDTYPVRDWYDAQSDEVKAQFDVDINFFRANPDWTEAYEVRALKKKYIGLHEIFVTLQDGDDEIQFGAIGAFRPDSSEFVLFVVCNRYSDEYYPGLDIALKYKQAWKKKDPRGAIYDYDKVMGQAGG